ncbi:MAG: VWA domain-containing protein [Acidobacteriota bacterium]
MMQQRTSRRDPRPSAPIAQRWTSLPGVLVVVAAACLALIASLTSMSGASSALAQQAPGVFGEIIDVRVVNVEVVVTDRDGNRVTGLSSDDFELVVDEEVVPIDYFTEVVSGQAMKPKGSDAPAGVLAAEEGPVGTSYLVFIDDFFALQRDRNRVLGQLQDEIPVLGPADRMAVVAYDGKDLQMLTSWTNSLRELERAFRRAEERPARGLERLADRRNLESDRLLQFERGFDQREFASGGVTAQLSPYERDYAVRLANQLENVVLAATATLRSFASPPGRKVAILLSGGWPLEPEIFAVGSRETAIEDIDLRSGSDLFEDLSDTANLLGYTLYPVDMAGTQLDTTDASQGVPTELEAEIVAFQDSGFGGQAREGSALPAQGQLTNLGLREFGVHGSLRFLAEETGGRPLINAQRDEPFAIVAEDTRTYYWLGFNPDRQEDDTRRSIEVRLKNPDYRVRSREGFFDFSRQREVSMMVESTLLFGNAPAAQPLEVQAGEQKRSGFGRVELPLALRIPMDAVTMLPFDGRYVGELELRVAALDDSGERSEVTVTPVRLAGESAPPEGSYSTYETSLRLRKADQKLVISLYDPPSGTILSTTMEVER